MARERDGERGLEKRADGIEPRVECGMWVKVGLRAERFWCRLVTMCADGTFVARVDNNLVNSAYRCGDEIVIRSCNVLDTADVADLVAFRSLLASLGPTGAAVAWHELRGGTQRVE